MQAKKRRGRKSGEAEAQAVGQTLPTVTAAGNNEVKAAGEMGGANKRPRGRPPLPGGKKSKASALTEPSAAAAPENAEEGAEDEEAGPAVEDATMTEAEAAERAVERDGEGEEERREDDEEDKDVPEPSNLSRKERALRKLGLGGRR